MSSTQISQDQEEDQPLLSETRQAIVRIEAELGRSPSSISLELTRDSLVKRLRDLERDRDAATPSEVDDRQTSPITTV
jgi:hypothetical protein